MGPIGGVYDSWVEVFTWRVDYHRSAAEGGGKIRGILPAQGRMTEEECKAVRQTLPMQAMAMGRMHREWTGKVQM